jgi:pimeloyl-ACP methyl ester carboxylesterase
MNWLMLLGVLVLASVAMGVTYQFIATARDRQTYPPPGKLIDVDGQHMHLYLMSNHHDKEPVIVLEAGATSCSFEWGWVQPEVAKFASVVAYDRAGLGWSDAHPQPRTARQVAQQLHTLLHSVGLPSPYILVGHSQGALFNLVYAHLYPDEVAGMVLVDPSHPDMFKRLPESYVRQERRLTQLLCFLIPLLAPLGIIRLTGLLNRIADGLPSQQKAQACAFYSSVAHLMAGRAELLSVEGILAEANDVESLEYRPLLVLSANKLTAFTDPSTNQDELKIMQELHASVAALSSQGTHRIVDGADHLTLVTSQQYAQTVTEAIRQVVEIVRQDSVAKNHQTS